MLTVKGYVKYHGIESHSHLSLKKITLTTGRKQTVGRKDSRNMRSGQSHLDLNEIPEQMPLGHATIKQWIS